MTPNTEASRIRFRRDGIDASRLGQDPISAFRKWHAEWSQTMPFDPMASTLATVDKTGRPSVRVMYLVSVDRGFVFLTNSESQKAKEVEETPHAAVCFSWLEIGRQVTVKGAVQKLENNEADAVFLTMPRDIRLVATVSHQSSPINDREDLEHSLKASVLSLSGREVVRPESWIGFRVLPMEIEFWQHRPRDLQDRIHYKRDNEDVDWKITRLSP